MKSYLLVTGDFVKTGGMDRANLALADYLARQGRQVHIVAHRVAPELLDQPNVTVHYVPKLANSYLLSAPLLDWVGRSQAQQMMKGGGRVLVNGGNCPLGEINWVHYVHAADHKTQKNPKSKIQNLKFFVNGQVSIESQVGFLRGVKGLVSHQLFLAAERRALQSARVIIANSNSTKQNLIERFLLSPQQIHTVYYGIEPQLFYPAMPQERTELRQRLGWSLEKPIVVFIGALGDRRKGFDTLFAAWRQLCADSNWDADLIAVGSGAELPLWQQRTAQAGLSSRIHFLGFRSDVPDLLRSADCLVAPTRYEAYGLGVHEALCCGLPALVSATAGVAERYPPYLSDLLLSNPNDAVELAARLRWWRERNREYCKLVNSFSRRLGSYTWDDMARSILEKMEESVCDR